MQKRIQSYISESQTLLISARTSLEAMRTTSPIDAFDILHTGVDRAKALFDIGHRAYDKGAIDRSTLMAAVELANAWLVFDDEVLEVVADAIPFNKPAMAMPRVH